MFNFGYAVVSCIKAKVLEALDNSSVYLANVRGCGKQEEECSVITIKITTDLAPRKKKKLSPNHQTPATLRKDREADEMET